MPTPEKTRSETPTRGPQSRLHERENASLRRELLAILVLYVAASLLPLLIGLTFGPESR